jgi:hypothetical protein
LKANYHHFTVRSLRSCCTLSNVKLRPREVRLKVVVTGCLACK